MSERGIFSKNPMRQRTRDGVFQRNRWWWIDYYDADGKRHRRKVAPDYQTAKIVYRQTMTAVARGEILGVREEGIRVKDFIERRYWPAVRGTLAPDWAHRSKGILEDNIVPQFGGLKLSAVRQEIIEGWYTERLGKVSAATANKELARLKHLLARAVVWGYLKANPAARIKKAKEAPGRVRYLAPEEREQLLQEANPVLRLYILAALHTGARRGELLRLQWADVDLRARTITFRRTKSGHARTVPMTDTLRETLGALLRPLDATALLLPAREPKVLSRSFARLVKRLGLSSLRFHDLRHDCASTLTMAGVPQRAIMEILGHRDPRMTMRYQHLSPGHLREAVRALDVRKATEAPAAEGGLYRSQNQGL